MEMMERITLKYNKSAIIMMKSFCTQTLIDNYFDFVMSLSLSFRGSISISEGVCV